MKVIEVSHKNAQQRVSIQPNLVTAHKSVGSIALDQGIYEFRNADLNVVWLLWRDSQDYDDGDELLGVFDDLDKAQEFLTAFGTETWRYSISCAEINDPSNANSYLEK